jgi:hypothetical protein
MRHTDLYAFYNRNLKQGDNLLKGLFGYHQKICSKPEKIDQLLLPQRIGDMSCENPHARNLWFQCLAEEVCSFLDIHRITDVTRIPVYLLSVASNDYTMVPNFEKPIKREFFRRSVAEYRDLVSHEVNFIGMVEPAVYVSSKQTFGVNLAYNFHCHGLLWGCRPQTVEKLCKDIRKKVYSSVPYLSPAHATRVNDGDLAQVLWYCTKFPNKQYQLWSRWTGVKQFKRQINGVNAVRLHHQMSHIRLDELTFGRGWGDEVIARASRSFVSRARKSRLP